ncbi:deoxyribodipyrimidine photo-lyase [Mariniflexile fucanivorans]|uniref:Cryptochrome DASH n=1 Tax=Mariniflexile fucanivorans TaxID=264023 RepID=A0A4V2QEE7_9FLAO|nr:DASH family cryptochrome [Mariniflexile fucanivorans]TCL67767.1 deoxyribodipyrimidine photo-lyase [Mariniflexile fucanivorans]
MQEKQNKTALVWFKNNLRVRDNSALYEASSKHENCIAIYCFDPRDFELTEYGFKKTEKYRAQFLIQSVLNLKSNLANLNINLLTYFKKPEDIIPILVSKYNIETIYTQKEWTPEEVNVLQNVKNNLPNTISIIENYDQFLYHPDDIKMDINQIPEVFTNFRKHLEKNCLVRKDALSTRANQDIIQIKQTTVPTLQDLGFEAFKMHTKTAFPFLGGEENALKRLRNYFFETNKLGVYKKTRNGLIGADFSSKFSPWLANGSLSARTIYWEVKQFEKEHYNNDSTYWLVFELIWRDYFKYISLKHGHNIFKIHGILNRKYHWNVDQIHINNWINGTTTEPFVNANMIELKKTGWMSNRGRQNVASFFAKELEIDWRIGAAYFEAMLIDYDVHSNYGNWMYVSGVGNDPRDRKFNIKLQAERYDPKGKFQNIWL